MKTNPTPKVNKKCVEAPYCPNGLCQTCYPINKVTPPNSECKICNLKHSNKHIEKKELVKLAHKITNSWEQEIKYIVKFSSKEHVQYSDSKYAHQWTDDVLIAFIKDLLSTAENRARDRVIEEIKGKRKYWHIRFERTQDEKVNIDHRKFNKEVTFLINSVLNDLIKELQSNTKNER